MASWADAVREPARAMTAAQAHATIDRMRRDPGFALPPVRTQRAGAMLLEDLHVPLDARWMAGAAAGAALLVGGLAALLRWGT